MLLSYKFGKLYREVKQLQKGEFEVLDIDLGNDGLIIVQEISPYTSK